MLTQLDKIFKTNRGYCPPPPSKGGSKKNCRKIQNIYPKSTLIGCDIMVN
jgi:hypothetical protein